MSPHPGRRRTAASRRGRERHGLDPFAVRLLDEVVYLLPRKVVPFAAEIFLSARAPLAPYPRSSAPPSLVAASAARASARHAIRRGASLARVRPGVAAWVHASPRTCDETRADIGGLRSVDEPYFQLSTTVCRTIVLTPCRRPVGLSDDSEGLDVCRRCCCAFGAGGLLHVATNSIWKFSWSVWYNLPFSGGSRLLCRSSPARSPRLCWRRRGTLVGKPRSHLVPVRDPV